MTPVRRIGLSRWLRAALAGGFVVLSIVASPAVAVEPNEMLPDPALEARARSISEGLRCLVCQNESIDESHAELARDIRLLVRQRLQAGDTNEAIRQYMVARYGQFILLRPPFDLATLALWGTPLFVLVGGATAIVLRRRQRRTTLAEAPLSASEQRELDELLARSRSGSPT